jgi:hypothetical protein
MQTCLIFGHNGLDLDITLNLRYFYRSLGFKVFFSDKLHDADLLVVIRAVDAEIDISPYHFSLIHIYDYLGCDYDAFVNSIDHTITYIFCTSEVKRYRLIQQLHFPEKQIAVAFPPVNVKLWSKKIKKLQYKMVHIGNFKPITDEDPIKQVFNESIIYFNTNIWGMGWNIRRDLYHGRIGLFSVSAIYAKSKFAFGLMYPFQRDVTFSGRFWQAPLNGCYVFSEVGLYTSKFPGIIETDYSINDIEHKMAHHVDRFALQNEAIEFWLKHYQFTRSIVLPTLEILKKNGINLNKACIYLSISMSNYLRMIYQKWSLFRFRSN